MEQAIGVQGEYEYVRLVSDELEEVEPSTFQAELEQVTGRSQRRLVIFNDTYLGIHTLSRGSSKARWQWLNLAFLDPRPALRPDPLWLAAGVCAALLAAVAAMIAPTAAGHLPGLPLLLSAAALAALVCAVTRPGATVQFRTWHGRAPVLRLARGLPDRPRTRAFLEELARSARRAVSDHDGTRPDYLRDEMKEHRRLVDQGVLSTRQFESARRLILGAHG